MPLSSQGGKIPQDTDAYREDVFPDVQSEPPKLLLHLVTHLPLPRGVQLPHSCRLL